MRGADKVNRRMAWLTAGLACATFLAGSVVGHWDQKAAPVVIQRQAVTELQNATNYAAWCGGYVSIEESGIYAGGCDR